MNQLLHTPEGVRDIYQGECQKLLLTKEKIHNVFSSYGYEDIKTPTFEFFDIYSKERGSVASKNMYKFFDREGYTLVLRPDMTPPIARCAAKYYMEEELSLRFTYDADTFINNNEHQGKLKEMNQMGCELIGDASSNADAEILAMAVESMLKAGLTEFMVEVGHADFFHGLVEEAGLDNEEIDELRKLINGKNFFGVEQFLDSLKIDSSIKDTLLALPKLFGNKDVLSKAKSMTQNSLSLKAIERLEKVLDILKDYGYDKYVTIDLGLLGNYNYYTGIVFHGYTYGVGDPILTGGRYDNLLAQFGKKAAATGFAIVVDFLMVALDRQKIKVLPKSKKIIFLYEKTKSTQAIQMARELRKKGDSLTLIRKRSYLSLEEYVAHAKAREVDSLQYLKEDGSIETLI